MSVSVGYYLLGTAGERRTQICAISNQLHSKTIRLQGILIDINLRYKKWTRGPWLSESVRTPIEGSYGYLVT